MWVFVGKVLHFSLEITIGKPWQLEMTLWESAPLVVSACDIMLAFPHHSWPQVLLDRNLHGPTAPGLWECALLWRWFCLSPFTQSWITSALVDVIHWLHLFSIQLSGMTCKLFDCWLFHKFESMGRLHFGSTSCFNIWQSLHALEGTPTISPSNLHLTVKQYLQQPPGDHWLYPSVTHRDVRLLFRTGSWLRRIKGQVMACCAVAALKMKPSIAWHSMAASEGCG